jgi:hypothetical protein
MDQTIGEIWNSVDEAKPRSMVIGGRKANCEVGATLQDHKGRLAHAPAQECLCRLMSFVGQVIAAVLDTVIMALMMSVVGLWIITHLRIWRVRRSLGAPASAPLNRSGSCPRSPTR